MLRILECSNQGFREHPDHDIGQFTVVFDVQKDAGLWEGPFLISRHMPARARETENLLIMERFDLRSAFGSVIVSETVTVDTNTGGLFQMLNLEDGRQFSMLDGHCGAIPSR